MALKTDTGPKGNPKGDPGAAGPTPAGGKFPICTSQMGMTRNPPIGMDRPKGGGGSKPPFVK